jgi:1,4-dihydroxy-2-naphthoate octaprenyltransferase
VFKEVFMNVAMWVKALQIIPKITKEEWGRLDVISRWLISTRAAVLIMTFISATIAGLLALRAGVFNPVYWFLVVVGLVFAHALNNLLNDLTDFERGVDKDNYYRTQYGPQPLQQGLMNRKELLTYAAVTGLIALAAGLYLVMQRGPLAWLLLAAGAIFVFFYTYPLKYIGLGEVAVLLVWGPLMIGGSYFIITGVWDWNVVLAGLPYALGTTTVIYGKHIDKLNEDKAKGIHTLPVIIGEKAARRSVQVMIALQYLLVIALVISGYFSPVMLVVLAALYFLPGIWKLLNAPRPSEPPAESKETWPMWFVAGAFYHNRIYGLLFLLGLILNVVVKLVAG